MKIKRILYALLIIGMLACLTGCKSKGYYTYEDIKNRAMMVKVFVVIGIVVGQLIIGGVCHAIVSSKGYTSDENNGFIWGFFLSLLGLIVCCAKPAKIIQPRQITKISEENTIEDKLIEIHQLKEKGLITPEEFEELRKKILNL